MGDGWARNMIKIYDEIQDKRAEASARYHPTYLHIYPLSRTRQSSRKHNASLTTSASVSTVQVQDSLYRDPDPGPWFLKSKSRRKKYNAR